MLLGVLPAIIPQSSAHAASAYLADENGETEITVNAGDDFQVVLYVVDITGVAGYECKITVSGPATPIGSAVHGDWFADNHTIFDGIDPVPADYHTAMLLSPMSISGSGAVVVFTLHADDDGIVAINVDSEYFLFAESDGDVIELDLPSTLYVSVLEGDRLSAGGEEPAETAAYEGGGNLLDSIQYTLYVNSTPVTGIIITGTQGAGGSTNYTRSIDENTEITLTAPATSGNYNFHHWTLGGTPQYPDGTSITFTITADTTAVAVYGTTWYVAHSGVDFDNIQAAINASDHGDTIIVRSDLDQYNNPTPYTGDGNFNIDFNGKAVTVRSENEPGTSVIDCEEYGQGGFIFHNSETNASILDGLRIRYSYVHDKGVIDSDGASPTIRNNTITNAQDNYSPGIWFRNSSALRIECNTIQDGSSSGIKCQDCTGVITQNIVRRNPGPGISVTGEGTLSITDNEVHDCSSTCGGGIQASGSTCAVIISNNNVHNNFAGYAGWGSGGGIDLSGITSATVTENQVVGNWSTSDGGGFSIRSCGAISVSDNEFTGNYCSGYGAARYGGGIYCINSSPIISENRVYGNYVKNNDTSQPLGGGAAFFGGGEPSQPSVKNNVFSGNVLIAVGYWSTAAYGGAVYSCDNAAVDLDNNTFHQNRVVSVSGTGGALFCSNTTSGTSARNCIFWENEVIIGSTRTDQEIALRDSAYLSLDYSDLKGGWNGVDVETGSTLEGGTGIVDTDPFFAEEGSWYDLITPEDYSDDTWTNGDYHLRSKHGRWSPAQEDWVIDGTHSPCIDGGDPESDYDAETEPNADEPQPNRFRSCIVA